MAKYTKTLTVDKLIKALQKLSEDGHGKVEVVLDGGCCTGDAGFVGLEGGQVCIRHTVLILKPPTKAELAKAARKAEENAKRFAKEMDILKVRPLTAAEGAGDFSNSEQDTEAWKRSREVVAGKLPNDWTL